jgi:hypothetical protein
VNEDLPQGLGRGDRRGLGAAPGALAAECARR